MQTGPPLTHNDWNQQIKKLLLLSFHWRMSQTRKKGEMEGKVKGGGKERGVGDGGLLLCGVTQ